MSLPQPEPAKARLELASRGPGSRAGTWPCSCPQGVRICSVIPQLHKPSIILTGKTENTGKLEAQIIKQVTDNLTLKFSAYYPNAAVANAHTSYEADYHGTDFNSSLKLSDGY